MEKKNEENFLKVQKIWRMNLKKKKKKNPKTSSQVEIVISLPENIQGRAHIFRIYEKLDVILFFIILLFSILSILIFINK